MAKMKLLFSKTDHHGQWFEEGSLPKGFTEKAPAHTGLVWDDMSGAWAEKPPEPQVGEEEEEGRLN